MDPHGSTTRVPPNVTVTPGGGFSPISRHPSATNTQVLTPTHNSTQAHIEPAAYFIPQHTQLNGTQCPTATHSSLQHEGDPINGEEHQTRTTTPPAMSSCSYGSSTPYISVQPLTHSTPIGAAPHQSLSGLLEFENILKSMASSGAMPEVMPLTPPLSSSQLRTAAACISNGGDSSDGQSSSGVFSECDVSAEAQPPRDNSPTESEASSKWNSGSDLSSTSGADSQSSNSSSPEKNNDSSSDYQKPSESYVTMIAKSILSRPEKRLMLGDIYSYIQEHYTYYKSAPSAWRNSVRHNLSVNECFMKDGRAENGRGYYWAIHPACVCDFLKGDFNRRLARRRVQLTNRALLQQQQQQQQQLQQQQQQQQQHLQQQQHKLQLSQSHSQLLSSTACHPTDLALARYHPYSRPHPSPSPQRATPTPDAYLELTSTLNHLLPSYSTPIPGSSQYSYQGSGVWPHTPTVSYGRDQPSLNTSHVENADRYTANYGPGLSYTNAYYNRNNYSNTPIPYNTNVLQPNTNWFSYAAPSQI